MNSNQLIQEVVSGGFEQYDEAGLIDYISLNRWIKNQLKRFGANIMITQDKTLEVINGKAKLPDNFWQLDIALKVDKDYIKVDEEHREDFLQTAYFYKQRNEVDIVWDNASESFENKNYKCIEEKIYLNREIPVTEYYSNPKFLHLTKGFKKDVTSNKYLELARVRPAQKDYQINIVGEYINTNFSEGHIYIQYKGLDSDEEGYYNIPECNHNKIEEYIIAYCRKRILEDLIMGDDPNKVNMLSFYAQETRELFKEAMTDAKWYGAQGWRYAMKKSIKLNSAAYHSMLPNR